VESYDASTQTCTVQLMVYVGDEPVPPLEDVKVKFPRSGGFRIIWPVQPGDEVTVEFSELDPSRWEASGELSKADVLRRHGLFATVRPDAFSDPKAYADAPTDKMRLGLQDATVEILIDGDEVRLGHDSADQYVALADLVSDELDRIKTELITLKSATNGVAVAVDAVAPGTSSAFATAAADVGGDPGDVAAEKVKAK
jgi:hypothetical protein